MSSFWISGKYFIGNNLIYEIIDRKLFLPSSPWHCFLDSNEIRFHIRKIFPNFHSLTVENLQNWYVMMNFHNFFKLIPSDTLHLSLKIPKYYFVLNRDPRKQIFRERHTHKINNKNQFPSFFAILSSLSASQHLELHPCLFNADETLKFRFLIAENLEIGIHEAISSLLSTYPYSPPTPKFL